MSKINFKPRTIFCRDNLDVLSGMNSGCIDLIYLDPPFNKNKVFTAPPESSAKGADFSDIFREKDVKDEWVKSIEYESPGLYSYLSGVKAFGGGYNYCYLAYMAIRLLECRRVLKETGSIYLHCDATMSHYLKIVMDCIFGEKSFRREIYWNGGSVSGYKSRAQNWIRQCDVILYYTKGKTFVFNKPFTPYKEDYIGKMFKPDKDGRMVRTRGGGRRYYADEGGLPCGDNWNDIYSLQTITQSRQKTGYPTQKPLALMERIISASSNKGDMVLDPFCGCATTCVAAENLGRQWAGVDISVKAYELVKLRIKREVTLPLIDREPYFRTTPPKRDAGEAKERGYVYVIGNAAYPNEWKVGIAKEPEKRLAGYQTADPKRGYALAGAVLTPYYREVERAVHKRFGAAHEWVKAESAQAVISAIKSAASKLERADKPRRRTAAKPRRRR